MKSDHTPIVRRLPRAVVLLASAWFALQLNAAPAPAADGPATLTTASFDVRAYGARGDGRADDTAAINQAIDDRAAAGGGTVLFPPGRFLSGTVQLRSHITLQLTAGATLVGTTNLEQYRPFSPPPDVMEARLGKWHRALVLGDGVEDVAIVGEGTIDGNRVFDPRGEERMRGPHTILLGNSRNITVRGISIRDSANYAVMLEFCGQVEIRAVRITGGWDGVHFRGWPGRPCRDVQIVGCQFFTGDDAIAGRYWENTLISGCVINSSCNGIRLIGPATHLIVHDCLFYGPGLYPHRTSNRTNMLAGINLQPGAWDATQGALDDVLISDVTLRGVTTPFHLSLKPGNTAGRITIERASATGVLLAAASAESWAETPIGSVVFRDVSIEYAGGGALEQAGRPVRAPGVDARPLPAWGFYGRNVERLDFQNVRFTAAKPDLRPLLMTDRVRSLAMDGCRGSAPPTGGEFVALNDVEQVDLGMLAGPAATPRCTDLRCRTGTPDAPFRAGVPFEVSVAVTNGPAAGLGQIDLFVGPRRFSRWTWLAANEARDVVFSNVSVPRPGRVTLRAGDVSKSAAVDPER